MSIERIFGFIILLAGITIIGVVLYTSFSIFTGKTTPPEIFSITSIQQVKQTADSIEAQLQNVIGEQLAGIIPVGTIPQLLNLSVWSMFVGLVIFGGAQIASLGVKLLKT